MEGRKRSKMFSLLFFFPFSFLSLPSIPSLFFYSVKTESEQTISESGGSAESHEEEPLTLVLCRVVNRNHVSNFLHQHL
ncbi:hypothetical protein F5H01DRAFT_90647 [Linnemannia elongata]|nr:hypothetical protein F5H01DRAFT_90647 [Linnemannia elongata]